MDIIPARSLTPNDLFALGLEFHKADRTVAGDFFAVGRGVWGG